MRRSISAIEGTKIVPMAAFHAIGLYSRSNLIYSTNKCEIAPEDTGDVPETAAVHAHGLVTARWQRDCPVARSKSCACSIGARFRKICRQASLAAWLCLLFRRMVVANPVRLDRGPFRI